MKNLENFKLEILNRSELLNTNGGVLQIGIWPTILRFDQELIEGVSTFFEGFIVGSLQSWIDHSKTIN